jgi:hypothetical protein
MRADAVGTGGSLLKHLRISILKFAGALHKTTDAPEETSHQKP